MKNCNGLYDFDQPVRKSNQLTNRLRSFKNAFRTPSDLSFLNGKSIYNSTRHVEDISLTSDNIICTTYFNTKNDPQRMIQVESNNIDFIAPWYYSIIDRGLHGIVFYDNLSIEFIQKYQTDKIKFVKCVLGDYSLNDERFIIYYMFFLKHKIKNLLLTDGNDVSVNKEPFNFFESKNDSTIFIGRGKENKLYQSKWNVSSINRFLKYFDKRLSNNFYEMPIYNAGIIGGNYYTVMFFLRQINLVFFKLDNNFNNNMAAMHYVLYDFFFPNCRKGIRGYFYNLTDRNTKIKIMKKVAKLKLDFILNEKINYNNDRIAKSKYIYSGFPLNSKFNFFEINSKAYLTHK